MVIVSKFPGYLVAQHAAERRGKIRQKVAFHRSGCPRGWDTLEAAEFSFNTVP